MKIFRPSALRALAAALVLVASSDARAQATVDHYVSDGNGIAYERIPSYRKEEFDFTVAVSREADRETRTLYERGVERRRWETESADGRIAATRYFEDGILREECAYRDGRPALMTERGADGAAIVHRYVYEGFRISSVIVENGSGRAVRTDTPLYAADGSSYGVRRSFADGRIELEAESGTPSRQRDSWQARDGRETSRKRDGNGNLVFEAVIEKGVTIERTTVEYDGAVIRKRTVEAPVVGTATVSDYDADGRLSVGTSYRDGAVSSRSDYSYDATKRLASVRMTEGATTTLVEYVYASDGSLAAEYHSRDGSPELKISYEPGGVRVEEYYHGGRIFARARFERGKKVSEAIIVNDVIVRERTFP